MIVLDVCCGSRLFYFDKENKYTTYMDKRNEQFIIGKKDFCAWYQDENGLWLSSCDLTWEFEDGSTIPSDHQMHYCPKCGRELNERGT